MRFFVLMLSLAGFAFHLACAHARPLRWQRVVSGGAALLSLAGAVRMLLSILR